jgi:hypothetical protein
VQGEKLHALYPSNITVVKQKRIGWTGHVASVGAMRNGYRILIIIFKGKEPRRRPRYRWKYVGCHMIS